MSNNDQIRSALKQGANTVTLLRNRTGLSHEDVYSALVALEAAGDVFLTVRQGKRFRVYTEWTMG